MVLAGGGQADMARSNSMAMVYCVSGSFVLAGVHRRTEPCDSNPFGNCGESKKMEMASPICRGI